MSYQWMFARAVLLLAMMLPLAAVPVTAKTESPDERAVVASFQALLDGLAHRDRATLSAQLLPGGSATLMRNGKPVQMSFDTFLDRLSAPGTDTREERIYDPLVRIDNDIAVLWAHFEFFLNGKVDHCGTDLVNLVKIDGRWLIASLSDNSRATCKK